MCYLYRGTLRLQTTGCAVFKKSSCLPTKSCAGFRNSSNCLQTNSCAGFPNISCPETNSCAGFQNNSWLQTISCAAFHNSNTCLQINSCVVTRRQIFAQGFQEVVTCQTTINYYCSCTGCASIGDRCRTGNPTKRPHG